jgi:hypothetical protein
VKKVNCEKVSRPLIAPQTLFAIIVALVVSTFNSSLI